ncbi:MAG: cell division protein FtsH, partial [Oligoflexia bacterium]|nr:cell division protein FtsH [Oligoflexia bacterium]
PKVDPIHKVTIIPRGMALGVTQTLPEEDILNLNEERANNYIAFLMGGRCAEEIIFGDRSNGAANDIERASDLARNMVCHWGMSELGPISYGKYKEHPFAGMGQDSREFSDETARRIDVAITNIVNRNYKQSTELLSDSKELLIRLAEALIVWETLDRKQIDEIVAGRDIGIPLGAKSKNDNQSAETVEPKNAEAATPADPTTDTPNCAV